MSLIEHARRNPVLKILYRLPGISWAYHFGLALFGAMAYRFPSRSLVVIGVTGTKGKTTVVELLSAALRTAGHKTAVLSSVHSKVGDVDIRNKTGNSMPGRFFIQKFLYGAKKAGCTHAIIEVTSQGVVQQRHRFIEWNMAVITNIAPEHIESHGSFEKYRDAKLAFMKYAVNRCATAFVNADDERSEYFKENLPQADTILYSKRTIEAWPENLFVGLPGEFNKENVAAVMAVSRKLEIPDTALMETLENFKGVPGRMEFVAREPFRVVVDYAHTPDSMEAVYKALRADMADGKKLIAVFGSCGGNRDKWKRPVMGGVAARYADRIILTNEDPYDEDPAQILKDIRGGIAKANFSEADIFEVLERGEAMRKAFSFAKDGDIVVMTGKGSETSIHIGNGETVEWSDRVEAEKALRNIARPGHE
jgi:UDP-N-acetylmuramoyl-L-alanyl-D-glutamate--2,6-diaminopimelate ligase